FGRDGVGVCHRRGPAVGEGRRWAARQMDFQRGQPLSLDGMVGSATGGFSDILRSRDILRSGVGQRRGWGRARSLGVALGKRNVEGRGGLRKCQKLMGGRGYNEGLSVTW